MEGIERVAGVRKVLTSENAVFLISTFSLEISPVLDIITKVISNYRKVACNNLRNFLNLKFILETLAIALYNLSSINHFCVITPEFKNGWKTSAEKRTCSVE